MHVAAQQIAMRRFTAAIRLNRYLGVHEGQTPQGGALCVLRLPGGLTVESNTKSSSASRDEATPSR